MVKLFPKGAVQSPVYNFPRGSYQIVFLGNDLNVCEYGIYDQPVIPEGVQLEEIERSADKVVYQIQVDLDTAVNVQFEVTNPAANKTAMIRQIVVGKMMK